MTDGCAETLVKVCPAGSVIKKVARVGEGVMNEIAVAFAWCVPRAAEYVLVASPEETISPAGAGTEVLNA